MPRNVQFVGFGFGAIQAGLFLYEAFRSGHFNCLTVAEIVPEAVEAVRRNGGRYTVNIATTRGIERQVVEGIRILNPADANDRAELLKAVAEAVEIATALPSVECYVAGDAASVAGILAEGLRAKGRDPDLPRAVIYTAENHNHAAEILDEALARRFGVDAAAIKTRYQSLNTVIGKMSGVVTNEARIREHALAPVAPGMARCFLVEEFNRILITKVRWPDFARGIAVFEEKPDLLPFEEAKLYGHNATHALIGYLAHRKGYTRVADAAGDRALMALAREAFVEESGKALCRRHAGVDPLFTEPGYRAYADDLLERMVNPWLSDAVDRVIRDPRRKLGWDDRLVGTIRVALEQGIRPRRYAVGAAAALRMLASAENTDPDSLLAGLWPEVLPQDLIRAEVQRLIVSAMRELG